MKPNKNKSEKVLIKPNYYLCGGGDLNCSHWDDINGCWRDCKYFGDENCEPPAEEYDEEEYDDEK